jgi:hypothetical protein
MKTYAYIINGVVWEIVHPAQDASAIEIPLASRYTSVYCGQCVDITNTTPVPSQGWSYASGKFSPPN